jgi:hypothetical protein
MPFDKSVDIDKIDDDRRKRVTKSIQTINIEELKKLADEIFHSPDDPWKQTLLQPNRFSSPIPQLELWTACLTASIRSSLTTGLPRQ